MEAAIGFEPMHGGFADLSLNHLGTPPPWPVSVIARPDPITYHAYEGPSIKSLSGRGMTVVVGLQRGADSFRLRDH